MTKLKVCFVILILSSVGISPVALADEDSGRIISGVLGSLLGVPPQEQEQPDAVYIAQEKEKLVYLLQSGEYATSRQGEPVDAMLLGIPLTRADHVYKATPFPPPGGAYRATNPYSAQPGSSTSAPSGSYQQQLEQMRQGY
ncbi:MAG: hypothetical protein JW937_06615 [Candidatus Omnitrophica bacterium]|nr:hypothetical protein [Candidatus Omnitrophota bacterium]